MPKVAEVESGKCFQLTFVDSLLDPDIGGGRGQRALQDRAGGAGTPAVRELGFKFRMPP